MYRVLAAIALFFSGESIASAVHEGSLSCESVGFFGTRVLPVNAACVIDSVDEMQSQNSFLTVQLSSSSHGENASLSSAQLMSEQQFWKSSFLREHSNLVIANDPLFHFLPNLCEQLQQAGFNRTKVLAFGVPTYASHQRVAAPRLRSKSNHLIEPDDFLETYSYVPYVLLVSSEQASYWLSELDMPHLLVTENDNLEQRVFDVVATSPNQPVLLIDDHGRARTSAWLSNLDINQLFLLNGGAASLLKMKGDIQRLNMARTGLSKRATCAGA